MLTTRIKKTLVTSIAVALTLVALVATPASAQSPFIIDGVVPANGTPTGPTQTADPFGSAKELGPINGSNTKVGVIHTAVPPMLAFTNPNGQVDLRNIWTQTAKASNGDLWFYFAWERDSNTGSGFIAYEFQQAALSPSCVYTVSGIDMKLPQSAAETTLINSCNPWANRQAGDFLILWDQSGNGLTITKRVFTLVGGQLVLGPSEPLGSAVVAISADGFRGEASVNLTTDVFPPDGSCVSFANILPGTVTGNSDSADYKDTVLALFPPITNCGSVTVTKVTQPAGRTGTFPYTLKRADDSPIRFDGTTQINQTLTRDGDSTGSPIQDLKAGDNYTLTEATQISPWQLLSIVCRTDSQPPVDLTLGGTFSVEAGTTTDCTITNKLLRGSLQVIKHVVNSNGGTAVASQFTISLGDNPTTPTTFAGNENPGNTFTFDVGQTFNVVEIGGPSGYTQLPNSGTCAGTIEANVTKVCTITNDDIPPRLTLNKVVINDNGGTATESAFTLIANGGAAGTLSGPGAPGNADVVSGASFRAGTYALSETGPSGYTASAWVCTGTGTQSGASITLGVGQSAVCTIVNNDNRAAPTGATVQRAILHDKLTIAGIRTGAPGAVATVTFRLYSDQSCSALVGTEGPVSISLTGTTGTATTLTGIGPVSASPTTIYYWRAQYTGDQFNTGFTTACGAEKTTVVFQP